MKKLLHRIFSERIRMFIYTQITTFFRTTNPKNYSRCGENVDLFGPLNLDPQKVELDSFVRLQPGIRIISHNGKVVVRKYSTLGAGTVIVPGSHIPTVGLPQYLSMEHINDTATTIVVNEDCWVGAGVYLLSHAEIGRGAVVAACSVVTKPVPSYAVVAGSPAKIIGVRFSKEQIMQHEAILYPAEERMSEAQIDQLFQDHFSGLKVIGTNQISDEDLQNMIKAKKKKGIPVYS